MKGAHDLLTKCCSCRDELSDLRRRELKATFVAAYVLSMDKGEINSCIDNQAAYFGSVGPGLAGVPQNGSILFWIEYVHSISLAERQG